MLDLRLLAEPVFRWCVVAVTLVSVASAVLVAARMPGGESAPAAGGATGGPAGGPGWPVAVRAGDRGESSA